MKRFFSVVALLFASLVPIGTSAMASELAPGYSVGGCSGTLIEQYQVGYTGQPQERHIYVYYSSANGGTNCAAVRSEGGYSVLRLTICNQVNPGNGCTAWKTDVTSPASGAPFTRTAGPLTGTDGHCIRVALQIYSPPTDEEPILWGPYHCG